MKGGGKQKNIYKKKMEMKRRPWPERTKLTSTVDA
jgi:hypothetical protein